MMDEHNHVRALLAASEELLALYKEKCENQDQLIIKQRELIEVLSKERDALRNAVNDANFKIYQESSAKLGAEQDVCGYKGQLEIAHKRIENLEIRNKNLMGVIEAKDNYIEKKDTIIEEQTKKIEELQEKLNALEMGGEQNKVCNSPITDDIVSAEPVKKDKVPAPHSSRHVGLRGAAFQSALESMDQAAKMARKKYTRKERNKSE